MNTYVTVEYYNGEVVAYSPNDNYAEAINHKDTADWVWQYADSKEQAVSQHIEKLDEWEKDPTKYCY